MKNILDIIFPRSCSICSKEGEYLCERCKKLFKRNLPECYICRRLSKDFETHISCMKDYSLNSVFVCWEYNELTSSILKRYKYSNVYDISESFSKFFVSTVTNSSYIKYLEDTIVTIVPISSSRMKERGFNQVYSFGKLLANSCNLDFDENILLKKEEYGHQALRDREERGKIDSSYYLVRNDFEICNHSSITIVDDVITTGNTLESITKSVRKNLGKDLHINAICLFRGKPFYSSESVDSSVFSSSVESA